MNIRVEKVITIIEEMDFTPEEVQAISKKLCENSIQECFKNKKSVSFCYEID